MKKIILSILFFLALVPATQNAHAANNNALGLWLQFNSAEAWGLDWKLRMSPLVGNDLYVSMKFGDDHWSLGLYDGYYFHYNNVIPVDKQAMGTIPLYWGPRVGVGLWGGDNDHGDSWMDCAIHIGITGGIAWDFAAVPIGIYMELNPTLEIRSDGHDDDEWHLDFPNMYFRLGVRGWLF